MSTNSLREVASKKAVIFDLDGTLIDTAGDLAAAMNHVLEECGHNPIPHDDVRHLVGFGAKAMLRDGFERSVGHVPEEEEIDTLARLFVDYYHDHIAVHSKPFEGMEALLKQLRDGGVHLAVCTNKRESLARNLLDTLSLDWLFDVIVGGDSAGVAKPDPKPVFQCLAAMKMMGLADKETEGKPEFEGRAVFIGDSDTDIRAAKAAGLPCLLATFGYGPVTLTHETAGQFDSYAQLYEPLSSLLDSGKIDH